MINVPAEWWTLALGVALPAVVALVRSRWGSSRLGALLLVGLTVLTAVASEVATDLAGNATFSLGDVAKRFVILFVTAVVFHFGLLKPAGITGAEGVIAAKVPGGIGAPAEPFQRSSRDEPIGLTSEGRHAASDEPIPGTTRTAFSGGGPE